MTVWESFSVAPATRIEDGAPFVILYMRRYENGPDGQPTSEEEIPIDPMTARFLGEELIRVADEVSG